MTRRAVLLGMNQPVAGAEPLDPRVPRSAGWNLWRMLHDRTGATQDEYRAAFERRNVLEGQGWDAAAARRAAGGVVQALQGARVVVLGAAPGAALGLAPAAWGAWQAGPPFEYVRLPHPSGRCREYNDLDTRIMAGQVLAELYRWQRGMD